MTAFIFFQVIDNHLSHLSKKYSDRKRNERLYVKMAEKALETMSNFFARKLLLDRIEGETVFPRKRYCTFPVKRISASPPWNRLFAVAWKGAASSSSRSGESNANRHPLKSLFNF